MEVLGAVASVITLAGLFKGCLESFDLIQVARKQHIDYEKLALRLNIERARLYTWGEAMGLTEVASAEELESRSLLQNSRLLTLIHETLNLIVRLFDDGHKLRYNYGCDVDHTPRDRDRLMETPLTSAVDTLAASFANFRVSGAQASSSGSRIANKTKWVIRDRRKFEALILEVRDLINGLQDITKSISEVTRQERMVREVVERITDHDTLGLIAEVSQTDYPELSEAASVRLEGVSFSTCRRQSIEAWMSSAGAGEIDNEEDDIDALSTDELRQLVRRMRAKLSHMSNAELRDDADDDQGELPGPSPPQTHEPQATSSQDVGIAVSTDDEGVRSLPRPLFAMEFSGTAMLQPKKDAFKAGKGDTNIVVATKQLLETLTQWSLRKATVSEVSETYVRMGYEFNVACREYEKLGIPTVDLRNVPDRLRAPLEDLLSKEASLQNLEQSPFTDVIFTTLTQLGIMQSRLRLSRVEVLAKTQDRDENSQKADTSGNDHVIG